MQNAWVRQVTAAHFASSAVSVWESCKWLTVEDCTSLQPVSEVGGYRQPLSAAYRTGLLSTIKELIAADRMRPAFLFERSRVLHMGEAELLLNGPLSRLDPTLASVSNLNEPADYERAHALPAPEIVVERFGPLAKPPATRRETVRAWSLGGVAAAVGLSYRDRRRD